MERGRERGGGSRGGVREQVYLLAKFICMMLNVEMLSWKHSVDGKVYLEIKELKAHFYLNFWTQLNFADFRFFFLLVFSVVKRWKKWQGVRQSPVAAIFPEAPPVVFTAKNTHGQTVGGFCHDLTPQLGSLRVNRGHVAISAEASTWITRPIHKGKWVYVCARAWGKGGLWGNESAT